MVMLVLILPQPMRIKTQPKQLEREARAKLFQFNVKGSERITPYCRQCTDLPLTVTSGDDGGLFDINADKEGLFFSGNAHLVENGARLWNRFAISARITCAVMRAGVTVHYRLPKTKWAHSSPGIDAELVSQRQKLIAH
jgi:hypothetical protein